SSVSSSLNWTPATPIMSFALAASVTVFERVTPVCGVRMDSEGAAASLMADRAGEDGAGAFTTVTDIAAEVVLLPDASSAIAVRACAPSAAVVVSHAMEYGAAAS